jgi:hypothetical protein
VQPADQQRCADQRHEQGDAPGEEDGDHLRGLAPRTGECRGHALEAGDAAALHEDGVALSQLETSERVERGVDAGDVGGDAVRRRVDGDDLDAELAGDLADAGVLVV